MIPESSTEKAAFPFQFVMSDRNMLKSQAYYGTGCGSRLKCDWRRFFGKAEMQDQDGEHEKNDYCIDTCGDGLGAEKWICVYSGEEAGNQFPAPDKICALTFDDGPSADPELTPLVLDKLESYGVVATFFMVGKNINEGTRDVVERIVSGGHEIGNHSWDYDDMAGMNADEIRKSVGDTTRAIQKYAGVTPAFFRAPNLSTSSVMFSTIDMPFAAGVVGGDWPGGGRGYDRSYHGETPAGDKGRRNHSPSRCSTQTASNTGSTRYPDSAAEKRGICVRDVE